MAKKQKQNGKANGKHLIQFEMETGVPIPLLKSGSQKYNWPFGTMDVGQVFWVPCDGVYDAMCKRINIYGTAKEWRQTGRRFVTRVVEDKKIGVWRIA